MNRYVFYLIFAAAIWGFGFIGTKWTLVSYSAIWSNAIRFIFAGLISLPFLIYKRTYKKDWEFFKPVIIASTVLFISFHFQTLGLQYTTAAKSGFITALYALFSPIIMMVVFKSRYRKTFWLLIFTALFGILCLCNLEVSSFNIGDFYTVLCAFFFAVHIIYIGHIAKNYNAVEFNLLSCFFMGVIAPAYALLTEGQVSLLPLFSSSINMGSILLGFIMVSIFSSLVAFSIQTEAQKHIPSHVVGVIFLLESVFAAYFGYTFLKESLTMLNIFGGGVILICVALIPRFSQSKSLSHN